jgi:hypothetical protein
MTGTAGLEFPLSDLMRYRVRFPGQPVHSLPTKPSLRMGMAVAVSRGRAEDWFVNSFIRHLEAKFQTHTREDIAGPDKNKRISIHGMIDRKRNCCNSFDLMLMHRTVCPVRS